MRAAITATGWYVPPDVYTNDYFVSRLETTDEWIRSRTGMVERRFAKDGGTSDLALEAARRCLDMRKISADAVDGIVVQNGNAYVEGIGEAFNPMKPFWADRNAETEKPVRTLLTKETTVFQYTHGVKDPQRISPDAYTFDQFLLDRPGNDAIQLELLHNYQSNVTRYEGWHKYFRAKQPRMLIVWGTNDPFVTVGIIT